MGLSSIGNLSSISALASSASPRKPSAEQLVKDMDADQNGSVSKQEFGAFAANMKAQQPKPTPSPDEFFSKLDQDGSGSLSVDELSAMMAEAETRAGRTGAVSGREEGAGPPKAGMGGPSGPMPGAGPSDSSGADSSDSAATSDPADADHDGTVTAAEKLVYEMTHASE